MESFVVRYRNLLVLLALLVAQILGLATQVRRSTSGQVGGDRGDGSSVKLIRYWTNSLVSPPEKALHSSGSGVSWCGITTSICGMFGSRTRICKRQSIVCGWSRRRLLEDAKQGQRLQALFNFQEKYIYKTLAAQTIGTSGTDQSRVFYIDKGKNDGVERDMAVITPEGIVGKIRDVFPHTAQVLAINDQSSGAGVILETTRIRGILRGNAAGQLQVEDVVRDQRIKPGENVLTAGGDEIFPRGMPVGVVANVANDPERDGFVDVIVKPAAHLDQLDEVLVVISTQPRFPPDQQQDIAASEALEGSETERQKASDGMAEKLPGLIVPNVPTDQQPLKDTSNPTPVSKPPVAIHPDRFTPGNGVTPNLPATPGGAPAVDGSGPPRKKPAPKAQESNPKATPPAAPQGENR